MEQQVNLLNSPFERSDLPVININQIDNFEPEVMLRAKVFTKNDGIPFGCLLGKTFIVNTCFICLLLSTGETEIIPLENIRKIQFLGPNPNS